MDYNRLQKVLRWNTMAYKPELTRFLSQALVAFGVVTLAQSCGDWINRSANEFCVNQSAVLCTFCFFIIMIVSASRVCFNMKTKSECISYTMLPAKKAEKFMANLIIQTIIVFIVTIIGLIAVDVIQAILSLISSHEAHSLTLATLSVMYDKLAGNMTITMGKIVGVALLIFLHASYTLGGAFFRRYQFFYTTLTILVINITLSSLTVALFAAFSWGMWTQGYEVRCDWLLGETWSAILLTAFILALSALFYYLAYRCFCRIQVINNKSFN